MAKAITIKCKNIIDELGLSSLPESKQEELISRMSAVVSDRVLLRIIHAMDKVEAVKATEMLENEDWEKVSKFMDEKFPDFNNILQEEITNFQQEMIKRIEI